MTPEQMAAEQIRSVQEQVAAEAVAAEAVADNASWEHRQKMNAKEVAAQKEAEKQIKEFARKESKRALSRVIGQALREGAVPLSIDVYLKGIGIQDPAGRRQGVEGLTRTPHLGAHELKRFGGRDAFRSMFSLPPAPPEDRGPGPLTAEDFVAYLPEHKYICIPTRDFWAESSLNIRVPSPDTDFKIGSWLDRNRHVEQMTWFPGHPLFIENRILAEGGWITREGFTIFNQYRPPQTLVGGDPSKAEPWLAHLRAIYPGDAEHIALWLAHRVQRPAEKLNHALVLGGEFGIGKDTILDPVRVGVGESNFVEVSPSQVMGRFNGFLKSVILRVSEARDLGDVNRYAFYEHLKTVIAAPPEVLRIDEKHLREYSVPNVTGVIITTNHKHDGIYLPPNDRRHYVAWSTATQYDFDADYWQRIYGWYEAGGREHVVAYLQTLSLQQFDAKAPPPKTEAWHDIVDSSRSPEESEVADTIDALQAPDAVTIADIIQAATKAGTTASANFADWLQDRKNRRSFPHRLEACGYVAARNPCANDGLWKVDGRRQAIYVKRGLPAVSRIEAARDRAGAFRLSQEPAV